MIPKYSFQIAISTAFIIEILNPSTYHKFWTTIFAFGFIFSMILNYILELKQDNKK